MDGAWVFAPGFCGGAAAYMLAVRKRMDVGLKLLALGLGVIAGLVLWQYGGAESRSATQVVVTALILLPAVIGWVLLAVLDIGSHFIRKH